MLKKNSSRHGNYILRTRNNKTCKHIHASSTKFNGEEKKKNRMPLAWVCSSSEKIF